MQTAHLLSARPCLASCELHWPRAHPVQAVRGRQCPARPRLPQPLRIDRDMVPQPHAGGELRAAHAMWEMSHSCCVASAAAATLNTAPSSPLQTIRFTAALAQRLLDPATRHQWDQTAFNEVRQLLTAPAKAAGRASFYHLSSSHLAPSCAP